ncbi:MAG: VacJ family lipoprotein [Methylomarinum sp.]|nr:VacJ family lipoprotein [Methylomarinum sp.]
MNTKNVSFTKTLLNSLLLLTMLNGCSSAPTNPDDPWEDWNRGTQEFNDDFDATIMKPLAKGYLFTTPEPIDRGVSNFFSNIDDIGVTINALLQFKLIQAGMDMSRFLINTTAGIAGFIDVSSMIDLPKHNEDFGQTLGVWGVPSGPYLVLPFWGPSSPRGTAGLMGDALMDPLNYTLFAGAAVSAIGTVADVVDVTDQRAGLMSSEKMVDEAAINRYDFIKNSYIQYREHLIYDGNVPEEDDFLELDIDFEEEPSHILELSPPVEE